MHVNKADFKGGKISRPVVPFMPQQLLWQKDDMTFIKALATFISHDIEFFLKAEFQRVFFITISLVFLNSSYGYFLRSCIIKVIKSFVHLYNFFFIFRDLHSWENCFLKSNCWYKDQLQNSPDLLFNSSSCYRTHSNSYLDIGGEKNPLIFLVRGVGCFYRKVGCCAGVWAQLFADRSLIEVPSHHACGTAWAAAKPFWVFSAPAEELAWTKVPTGI